jgi:antitoxin VapB
VELACLAYAEAACCTNRTYAEGIGLRDVGNMAERRVRLFKNGRNQAVRIPREFELPGNDAIIRREGRRLIIEPAPPKSLLAVLATLAALEEDFPPTEDRLPEPAPSLPSPAPSPLSSPTSGGRDG